MLIINCFSFVMAIIEIIKRIVNDLDFHFMPAIQIALYLIFFISMIKGFFCMSSNDIEIIIGYGSFFCILIIWIIEIIIYFKDLDKKQAEELIQLFIIFKIYGYIIVYGIDIIFIIIASCF